MLAVTQKDKVFDCADLIPVSQPNLNIRDIECTKKLHVQNAREFAKKWLVQSLYGLDDIEMINS